MALPTPVQMQIRPATGGMNVSVPTQTIKDDQCTDIINLRFRRNIIETRKGFTSKYKGLKEPPVFIDLMYNAAGSQFIYALTRKGLYYVSGTTFVPMPTWAADGSTSTRAFDFDESTIHVWSDMGDGRYDPAGANGGSIYPSAGGYAPILFLALPWQGTTSQANGFVAIFPTGGGVEAELLSDSTLTSADVRFSGPKQARAVAVWDWRVIVGGDQDNNSYIQWSAQGRFDYWNATTTPVVGAGEQLIGEGPDWIQGIRKMGEYVLVYKEKSLYVGRKTGIAIAPLIFSPHQESVDCAAPMTIDDLDQGTHICLGWSNVNLVKLDGAKTVGDNVRDEMFYGTDGIVPKYISKCFGYTAEEYDEYWLFTPTGKVPAADSSDNPLWNLLAQIGTPGCAVWQNPILSGTAGASNYPTAWTATTDGTFSYGIETGGNFGGQQFYMTKSTGTFVNFHPSNNYNRGSSCNGRKYSILVWAKADSAIDMTIALWDGTSYVLTRTISLTTSFAPYVLSGTISTSSSTLRPDFVIGTNSIKVTIDAVQFCDITDMNNSYIYNDGAYQTPGYIGVNQVEMIPFILDRIGPWVCDTAWVLNLTNMSWSKWRLPVTGFGYDSVSTVFTIADLVGTIGEQTWAYDSKLTSVLAPSNLISTPDGTVYEIRTDLAYDWNNLGNSYRKPIMTYWVSKNFDLGRPDVDKTWSRLLIFHDVSHPAVDVTVSMSTDGGANWTQQIVTIRSGFPETYADFFVTGSEMMYKVECNVPTAAITGFSIKLIARGESNAY